MVYVGVPMWPYRSFVMCHMFADTEKELDEMADKIGLRREWKQIPDRPAGRISSMIHYDIAKSKRALAIKEGAIPLDTIKEEVDVLTRLVEV